MKKKYVFVFFAAAVILMLAGCNNPPNIPRITPSATLVEGGDIITLSAFVSDPDNENEELTLTWTATGGDFDVSTGLNVHWTAPDVTADEIFTITLTVEDPEGATNSEDVDITVVPDSTPDEEVFEIILGSAESTFDFPFNEGNFGRSQFLYFADEIDTSGKIVKMALMPSGDSSQTFTNVKIWFIPVNIDSVVDTLDNNIGEATKFLVYQGATVDYGIKDEWFEFEFTSPFEYDGIENLLIQFQFDIFDNEVAEVPTYGYGSSTPPVRHVGIVRAEDGRGIPKRGVVHMKLIFEKPEE